LKIINFRQNSISSYSPQIGSDDPLTGNKDITQEVEFVEDEAAKSAKLYSNLK
jgi:hypothetical protein